MSDNVLHLPSREGPPEFMIGPFEEYRIVIEGKLIPKLTAFREGDDICLVLDHRLSISISKDRAYDVAWLVANAMAIGAGYPSILGETRDLPFATNCVKLETVPPPQRQE